MKSKIKKTLIIFSSAIVLFFGVFFMTRSLNNLVQSSNKSDITDVNEASSKENSNAEDKVQVSKDNNVTKNTSEDTAAQSANNSTPEKYTDYVVQKGDTLYSIARKAIPWKSQEEAVKLIETMNNIKDREIIVSGLRLMVPVNTIDTTNCIKYSVQPGETLYNIAEEYLPTMDINKAVQVIMQKNNISNPDILSVGLEIYIPEGETEVNAE